MCDHLGSNQHLIYVIYLCKNIAHFQSDSKISISILLPSFYPFMLTFYLLLTCSQFQLYFSQCNIRENMKFLIKYCFFCLQNLSLCYLKVELNLLRKRNIQLQLGSNPVIVNCLLRKFCYYLEGKSTEIPNNKFFPVQKIILLH